MATDNANLITRFLSYLHTECGAGDNTVASYENDVRKFAAWLLPKPLTQAQRNDISQFISAALTEGLSGRSAARRLSCLRHFYRFLVDEEEISAEPTRNLPVPKSWKTVPKALSLADLDKMLTFLGASWIDIRDRAILLTFFASGLRESELAALKLQDLDLEAGAAKVWDGKGGKDGIVPLSPPAIAALKLYIETVRPNLLHGGNDNHVFLSKLGGALSRMAIWYRVSRIAKAALGKHISPHFLRHGFATALVEGGADIRDVQVLMRHSDVDTTAIYVHTDLNYLRRIYYASHPRARIAQVQG